MSGSLGSIAAATTTVAAVGSLVTMLRVLVGWRRRGAARRSATTITIKVDGAQVVVSGDMADKSVTDLVDLLRDKARTPQQDDQRGPQQDT